MGEIYNIWLSLPIQLFYNQDKERYSGIIYKLLLLFLLGPCVEDEQVGL